MEISLAIMAHPKRRTSAQALYAQLQKYPFSDAYIIWDDQNSEWHTGERALRRGIGRGAWHIVIQDDALLTPDFYTNLDGAIRSAPMKTLISLYTGAARPIPGRVEAAIAKTQNGGWLRFHQLLWGVGIAIPSDHIEPMLDFVKDVELQYDNKVGEFYCQNGLPVYYCIPSLVNHDDALGSLIPGHGTLPGKRVAHRVADGPIAWSHKEQYI